MILYDFITFHNSLKLASDIFENTSCGERAAGNVAFLLTSELVECLKYYLQNYFHVFYLCVYTATER